METPDKRAIPRKLLRGSDANVANEYLVGLKGLTSVSSPLENLSKFANVPIVLRLVPHAFRGHGKLAFSSLDTTKNKGNQCLCLHYAWPRRSVANDSPGQNPVVSLIRILPLILQFRSLRTVKKRRFRAQIFKGENKALPSIYLREVTLHCAPSSGRDSSTQEILFAW